LCWQSRFEYLLLLLCCGKIKADFLLRHAFESNSFRDCRLLKEFSLAVTWNWDWTERDLKSRGLVVMCEISSWNSKRNTWEGREMLQIWSKCNING
jgi:hypothetical protein